MSARAAAASLLAAGALLVGCGGGDEAEPSTATAASTGAIDIADFAFSPEEATVKAGSELTWTNADDAAHTATADDGSFDTGTLKQGDAGNVTLDKPGTYTYFCRFHPFMKGTVEVQ
jgi:plastocyanin